MSRSVQAGAAGLVGALAAVAAVVLGAGGGPDAARRAATAATAQPRVGAEAAAPAAEVGPRESRAGAAATAGADTLESAIFAGGCFWCMEPPFDELEGVTATTSGYIGGDVEDPTYEQVSSGETGHVEAVRVTYDPERVGYRRLLQTFWLNVDPTDAGGQFCDRGPQYVSAIFAVDAEQRRLAEASKDSLSGSGRLDEPIVTPIRDAGTFYPAEEYHQDYYEKNPIRYKFYRFRCGRDRVLDDLWGGG